MSSAYGLPPTKKKKCCQTAGLQPAPSDVKLCKIFLNDLSKLLDTLSLSFLPFSAIPLVVLKHYKNV